MAEHVVVTEPANRERSEQQQQQGDNNGDHNGCSK